MEGQPSFGVHPRVLVLVEGKSDQAALRALARRQGRDLDAEGVTVVAIGGATNIGHFLDAVRDAEIRLAGLCDAAEEDNFRRALERAGLGSNLTRAGMERLGFHVCVADLEDELIRALGAAAVEAVIAAQGELAKFRTFQRQPWWQGRAVEEQMRRFLGTLSGRKTRYARVLVEALDETGVPPPLERVLAYIQPVT